jgi:hypothetical protein
VPTTSETKKYSATTCNTPIEDRTALIWQMGLAKGIIGVVAFGLRCVEKMRMGIQSWGADDWVITAVVCLFIPLSVFTVPRTFAQPLLLYGYEDEANDRNSFTERIGP